MEAFKNLGWICSTAEQVEPVGCGTEGRAVGNSCPWLDTDTRVRNHRYEGRAWKVQICSYGVLENFTLPSNANNRLILTGGNSGLGWDCFRAVAAWAATQAQPQLCSISHTVLWVYSMISSSTGREKPNPLPRPWGIVKSAWPEGTELSSYSQWCLDKTFSI